MAGPRYKQFTQPDAGSSFVQVGDTALGGAPGDISGGAGGNDFHYDSSLDLLNLTGDVTIGGDLTVQGTTITVGSEIQIADRYILMNSEYTAAAALDAGLVINTDPAATSFAISDITSDVITVVSGDPSAVLGAGDFILVQNPADASNAGIYEVLSATSSDVTIDPTPVHAWSNTAIADDATTQGTVVGVGLSIIRASSTGSLETAFGTTAPLAFGISMNGSTGDFSATDGTNLLHWDASAGSATASNPATTDSAYFTSSGVVGVNRREAGNLSGIAHQYGVNNGSGNGGAGLGCHSLWIFEESTGSTALAAQQDVTWRDATVNAARTDVAFNVRDGGLGLVNGLLIGNSQAGGGPRRVEVPTGIMVGPPASITAALTGDIVAGDGTNEMFWDASTGNFSLRTGTEALLTTFTATPGFFAQNSGAGVSMQLVSAAASATASPGITMRRSQGTTAAPTAVSNADRVFALTGQAYIGSTSTYQTIAGIDFVADGAPTDTSSAPGRIEFNVTTAGSLSVIERMRLNNAGGLAIGNIAGLTSTPALGDIVAGDGTNELVYDADNVIDGSLSLTAGVGGSGATLYGRGSLSLTHSLDAGTSGETAPGETGANLQNVMDVRGALSDSNGVAGLGTIQIFRAEGDGGTQIRTSEHSSFWRNPAQAGAYADHTICLRRGGAPLTEVFRLGNSQAVSGDYRLEVPGGGLMAGAIASITAAETGDIVAGDGTNGELRYDAGTSALTVSEEFGALAGIQHAEFEVLALSGATGTATGLIPAGSMVLGVTTHITTAITGTATSFEVGDGADQDRWGSQGTLTLAETTDPTNFTDNTLSWSGAVASDVVLTAVGGTFTTGAVRVVVTYMSLTAPTS